MEMNLRGGSLLYSLSVIDGHGRRVHIIHWQVNSDEQLSLGKIARIPVTNADQSTQKTQPDQVYKCRARMDPMLASCVTCMLQRSTNFRHAFMVLLLRHCRNRTCLLEQRTRLYVKIKLLHSHMSYFTMEPDIRWSNRMLPLWIIRLVIEDAFSWLSTLGGAYSSLGEKFSHCAIEAGRLSLRQLKLAFYLGDPFLQARCFIYLALSLMQRGFLKHAKDIIRHQYKFAISFGEYSDTRLIAMCHGVWCHLKFYHQVRRQNRTRIKNNVKHINGTSVIDTMCS